LIHKNVINRSRFRLELIDNQTLKIIEQLLPTPESSQKMLAELEQLMIEEPINKLLIDLTGVKKAPSKTRKIIVKMLTKPSLDKVALFGPSIAIRVMASFIMQAAGLHNTIFFATEEDALVWLES
jgi:hypothetical protein